MFEKDMAVLPNNSRNNLANLRINNMVFLLGITYRLLHIHELVEAH